MFNRYSPTVPRHRVLPLSLSSFSPILSLPYSPRRFSAPSLSSSFLRRLELDRIFHEISRRLEWDSLIPRWQWRDGNARMERTEKKGTRLSIYMYINWRRFIKLLPYDTDFIIDRKAGVRCRTVRIFLGVAFFILLNY